MQNEKVILVDIEDNPIGEMDKLEVHRKALLHRAVSVFLFNSKNQMLLQKRAPDKYHSKGLWTNTACTHPYPNETNMKAAQRRLKQEMGIEANLSEIFHFIYKEELDSELTEHEYDHVFLGYSDHHPNPDPNEVSDYKYIYTRDLLQSLSDNPQEYTIWFRKIAEQVINHHKEK